MEKMAAKASHKTTGNHDLKKGDLAREKILWAAREVFSELPYNAASLRMIAKKGGFDHPLIRYYFPTKADLFAAVVEQIVSEFMAAHFEWLSGLETMSPSAGLPLLLDRVLGYDREHPHGMRIIMQNIAQVDKLEMIPGYHLVPKLFGQMSGTFRKKVPLSASTEEIDMFFSSLIACLVNFLGASRAHAQVLGMDPVGRPYRDWVKTALLAQFIPWLGKLALPVSGF